ncbi:DUF2752 domain-containing protein [Sphingobacterium faecium]|nr:DUF2752 domain-containing protein [Sphingobacterium faecium]PTX11105.1 uncharacterized protein DUF2752 [Sphingobacterium faecium]
MNFNEYRKALYITWVIISIFIIIFLLLFYSLDNSFLLAAAPTCPSKLKGSTCFLCGMTRAFLSIKDGQYFAAQQFNSGSVILFSLIFINSIIFIIEKMINLKKI